jgi:hypothetical protein
MDNMVFNSFSLDIQLAKNQANAILSGQNISEQNLRAGCKVVQDKVIACLLNFKNTLRELETSYRQEFLPPPTREKPFADKEALAFAKSLNELGKKLEQKEVVVRNSINPNDDNIAKKYRDNKETLLTLSLLDEQLLGYVQQFQQFFSSLDFNLNSFTLMNDSSNANYVKEVNKSIYQANIMHIDKFVNEIGNLLRQRQDFLKL